MTLDDLELLQARIFGEFRGISQIWEATRLLTNGPVFCVVNN